MLLSQKLAVSLSVLWTTIIFKSLAWELLGREAARAEDTLFFNSANKLKVANVLSDQRPEPIGQHSKCWNSLSHVHPARPHAPPPNADFT